MKKKLGLLVLIMMFSLTVGAQNKFEIEAQATVNEINDVVSLSQDEQKKVYDVLLQKSNEIAAIRKEYAGDKEAIKMKVAEVNKKSYAANKEILGDEKMKTWTDYTKAKKEKANKEK